MSGGAEKITPGVEEGDWPECLCGNAPDMDGFYPCLPDGTEVEPLADGPWDGVLLCCAKCGRIFDQDTLEVKGRRQDTGPAEIARGGAQ